MAEKMRLVCPNCSAQYEVDASAIPAPGRDVQCSNCGHTWWQRPVAAPAAAAEPAEAGTAAPEAAPEAAAADGDGMAEAPAPAPAPEPAFAPSAAEPLPAPASAAAPRPPAGPAPAPDEDGAWPDEDEEGAPPRISEAARNRPPRTLDEAVLDVLREEAEREARARRSEGAPAAVPDAAFVATLGRGEGEREAAVRERMEAIEGIDETARSRGNQRLPDVEEINSTLEGRVATPPPAEDEPALPPATRGYRRAGFRVGFVLTLTAALALLLAYVFADAIVARAPSLQPGMTRFTERVDAGRLWLNGAAVSATEAIRDLTRTE
ncbi:MAG: zinc-ribbon domain-containing protein [Rhodobacteraceae bacterium]|nr:zinc-ribbon domain-containing protein [Paracoccaceae bacterium]